EEDAALEHATRADGVEVAVLAVGVDGSVAVDRHRVDAPLEAVPVLSVVEAGDLSVRLPRTRLRIGGCESPLDVKIGGKLRDVVRPAGELVIVLEHDRGGDVVREPRGRAVPAEADEQGEAAVPRTDGYVAGDS